jgi:hypothetical protein
VDNEIRRKPLNTPKTSIYPKHGQVKRVDCLYFDCNSGIEPFDEVENLNQPNRSKRPKTGNSKKKNSNIFITFEEVVSSQQDQKLLIAIKLFDLIKYLIFLIYE